MSQAATDIVSPDAIDVAPHSFFWISNDPYRAEVQTARHLVHAIIEIDLK